MTDHIGRARRFVEGRFPEAPAAFLGGSAASGRATRTSDLDVLVVLPDARADVAFVETTTFQDQLVEAFVYGPAGLQVWLEKGRADRRPVLDKLIGGGIGLTEGATTDSLQAASRKALAVGPQPLAPDELLARRYSLSAIHDDLMDATDTAERFMLSAAGWRYAAELALLTEQRWLGSDKWLCRELQLHHDRFGLLDWATGDQADLRRLAQIIVAVLDAAGGYLQDGYLRGVRPPDL